MKKTIITLLSLAGVAAASNPIWISPDGVKPSSYSLTNKDSFSVAITLNIQTLEAESGENFNGSAKIIDLTGTWNTSQLPGTMDININGSSSGHTSTLYIGSTPGRGNYASNYSLTGISAKNIFDGNTDWELIDAASLVFVKNGSGDNDVVSAYFKIKYKDGSDIAYEGSNTGMKFTIDHDNNEDTDKVVDTHLNVSTITFANNFATSAQVYGEALSSAEAKKVGAALLVPEPATATLSLLALAGLAARRRRK